MAALAMACLAAGCASEPVSYRIGPVPAPTLKPLDPLTELASLDKRVRQKTSVHLTLKETVTCDGKLLWEQTSFIEVMTGSPRMKIHRWGVADGVSFTRATWYDGTGTATTLHFESGKRETLQLSREAQAQELDRHLGLLLVTGVFIADLIESRAATPPTTWACSSVKVKPQVKVSDWPRMAFTVRFDPLPFDINVAMNVWLGESGTRTYTFDMPGVGRIVVTNELGPVWMTETIDPRNLVTPPVHLAERRRTTNEALAAVDVALEIFKIDHGRYPASLAHLLVMPPYARADRWPARGYLPAIPRDGWDRDLAYGCPDLDGTFDLFSLGADGLEGGEGEAADIRSGTGR